MFDKLTSRRSSFESDKSSFKGKLRALVLPTQASGQFTTLSDSYSTHSDQWSLSSTEPPRSGPSPGASWVSCSNLSVPGQAHVAGRPASTPPPSRTSPIPMVPTPRPKFYSHSLAKSAHSLRLDPTYTSSSSPFPDDYLQPGAKHLSPIAEQDYFSPERRSLPLPSERDITLSSSSPDGSEITR